MTPFEIPALSAYTGQPMTLRSAVNMALTAALLEKACCSVIADELVRYIEERQADECGSRNGYYRHQRAGETPCENCATAHRQYLDYLRAYRRTKGIRPRDEYAVERAAPCGTRSGYHRHLRAGEAACDRCRKANSDYVTSRKRASRPTS